MTLMADGAQTGRSVRCGGGADSYPPIESYAFLADGQSAALTGPDGAVEWLCAPRFDGASVFARLLDRERGGAFELTVKGSPLPARRYVDGTLVLKSRFESEAASVGRVQARPQPGGSVLRAGAAGAVRPRRGTGQRADRGQP